MTEHFKQCFRVTDKECIEGIYPRCDIFRWHSEKLKQFIYRYEPAESLALIEKLKNVGNHIYICLHGVKRERISL